MILWNVRADKTVLLCSLTETEKTLHTTFLQQDTLIITTDTFTLCTELSYEIIVLGSSDSKTLLHLVT